MVIIMNQIFNDEKEGNLNRESDLRENRNLTPSTGTIVENQNGGNIIELIVIVRQETIMVLNNYWLNQNQKLKMW